MSNPTKLLLGILLLLVMTGCNSPETPTLTPPPTATATPEPPTVTPSLTPTVTSTPTLDVPFEEVTFTTDDDIEIAATLFGEGDTVVIFLHMGLARADQTSWHPFAREIANLGFSALTVDFRGVGKSGGTLNVASLYRDANAAAEFLHSRGFDRLACVGASMGGTACLRLAMETDLIGMGIVSSTRTNHVTDEDLASFTFPKLFIWSDGDFLQVVTDMRSMYYASRIPKEKIVYQNSAHGTYMFSTPDGDDFRQALLDFLLSLP